LDLRHLRFFIVVAEELNFTRAASRLNTVQPSLSTQIRRLEEIVGTPLFYRTSHLVTLTPAGRIFLEDARKIVADIDRAIERANKVAHSEVGELSLGIVSGMEMMIFPQIMPKLQKQYPDIRFNLISSTDPDLISALRHQLVDVVFCAPITDQDIATEITSEVVFMADLVVVLPAKHPLAQLERVPISKLADEPFIQPLRGKYPFATSNVKEMEAQAGVRFRNIGDADGALACLNAVSAGVGFGFIPDFMARDLPANVKAIPFDLETPPQSPIAVAYRKGDMNPALQLFVSFLHDYLRGCEVEGAVTEVYE
jgi:LysR family transcriptional regulator, hca operon transcriptional activator